MPFDMSKEHWGYFCNSIIYPRNVLVHFLLKKIGSYLCWLLDPMDKQFVESTLSSYKMSSLG